MGQNNAEVQGENNVFYIVRNTIIFDLIDTQWDALFMPCTPECKI